MTALVKHNDKLELADLGIDQKGANYLKMRYPKAPRDVLIDLCLRAKATGLDVLTGQILPVERGGKWTLQTSIEGLRASADRTGDYVPGNTRYEYDDDGNLMWAYVGVKKWSHGSWHEYEAGAKYSEYKGHHKTPWGQLPHVMLAKCAEAQALRRGWPYLSKVYIPEEMDQADTTPRVGRDDVATYEIVGERNTDEVPASEYIASLAETHEEVLGVIEASRTVPHYEGDGLDILGPVIAPKLRVLRYVNLGQVVQAMTGPGPRSGVIKEHIGEKDWAALRDLMALVKGEVDVRGYWDAKAENQGPQRIERAIMTAWTIKHSTTRDFATLWFEGHEGRDGMGARFDEAP